MPSIREQMEQEIEEKTIFELAKNYAYMYMDSVRERRVYPDEDAIANLVHFTEKMPQHPADAEDMIRMLHRYGSPATLAQTGGRYYGFVNGNSIPAALAARWLADIWDQNTAVYVMSPIAAHLEQMVQNWMIELLGLPDKTVMGLVSGTSTATMIGLAAARYALLKKQGWDVSEDGLFGAPEIRVVVSEEAHSSVYKALSILGLGKKRIELVEADEQGRISPEKIPELDSSCILLLQAGNVNTGAFDNFNQICKKAQEQGAWVHIDGAFGLWAACARSTRYLTEGIELADSWSLDAHKTLNTPYDCGIVLCKHREALVSAMHAGGSYIQFSDKRDNMHYVPEMSRRARGVDVWACLKYLGKNGLDELVTGFCGQAQILAAMLEKEKFKVLNEVVFNQVLVAGDSAEQTEKILRNLQDSGIIWLGGTTWNNKPAIRISICSWATTTKDLEITAEAFVHARSL